MALKEWAVLCDALVAGRQSLLLRKGGISESNGEFELEHSRFVLFPTYVHQKADSLKAEYRTTLDVRSSEPNELRITGWAEVTDIVQLHDRRQMDELADLHIWDESLVDMRFNYRPYNPLYLMLVRAHRLAVPVMIENCIDYNGCRSWVPLNTPIEIEASTPAVEDEAYERLRRMVKQRLAKAV